jgi:superfamily II DNA/RNA helicase
MFFLSATPPMIENELFGDYLYKYDWNKAIENKYICDFKIIQPGQTINENKIFSDFLDSIEYNETDKSSILKLFYILKGIIYYGNKKTIIYVSNIKEAENYYTILEWLQKLLQININTYIIDYTTSKIKRKEYINNFIFRENNQILLNVQILNEGIDIPECDSIFITNPSDNMINLIQRMCRCNRVLPNKHICFIYLWSDKIIVDKINNYLNNIDNNIINKLEYFDMSKIKKNNENENNIIKNDRYNNIDDFLIYLKNTINKDDIKSYIDFIDDFFSIYDKTNKTNNDFFDMYYSRDKNSFSINIEAITKWFDMRKGHIKDTLIESYVKNIDYIVIKNNPSGKKGKPSETILLTHKCFKIMIMKSKTKKAVQMREYYYELEQILNQYKENIIRNLEKKINTLEKSLI